MNEDAIYYNQQKGGGRHQSTLSDRAHLYLSNTLYLNENKAKEAWSR